MNNLMYIFLSIKIKSFFQFLDFICHMKNIYTWLFIFLLYSVIILDIISEYLSFSKSFPWYNSIIFPEGL